MQRISTISSQIKSFGYGEGILEIEFNSRDGTTPPVYQYTGSKVKDYFDGLHAEHVKYGSTEGKEGSVGSYFIKNVRACTETKCVKLVSNPHPPAIVDHGEA